MHDISLRPGERIEKQFGVSVRFLFYMVAIGIVLLILLPILVNQLNSFIGISSSPWVNYAGIALGVFVFLIFVLYAAYFRVSRWYVLTNERVVMMLGWLSRRTTSAEYDDVTDLTVNQDAFERLILHIGTLGINTAGSNAEELVLTRIDQPYETSDMIRDRVEKSRAASVVASSATGGH